MTEILEIIFLDHIYLDMQLLVKEIIYNSWQLKPYLIMWNVKTDIFLGKKEISLECMHFKSGLIVSSLSFLIIILTKFFKIENLNYEYRIYILSSLPSTHFISACVLLTPSIPVLISSLCQDVELWQVYFTTSRILVICTNSLICGL